MCLAGVVPAFSSLPGADHTIYLDFDGHTVQGTEFTPKDVYTLNVFDKNYKKPEICEKNDPGLPYGCQFLGKYRFTFPGYNSIKPYENMAEHCPTEAPDYFRPANC